MLATMLKAGGFAPVTFSSSNSQSGGATLVLPATTVDQMLVLMERTNSTTPAAVRTGFVNILSLTNTPAVRSMRVSYAPGPYSGASINFGASSLYVVVNNARAIGVINTFNSNTTASPTTLTIPSLTGVLTTGTSMSLYLSYEPSLSAVSSPYTLVSAGGGYISTLTANPAQGSATAPAGIFNMGATIELRTY